MMTWRAYIKLLTACVLFVVLLWIGHPHVSFLREWTSYRLGGLNIPEGFPPRSQHLISCRNHASFVQSYLGRHVLRHAVLAYDADKPGEEVFCRIDFDGIGQNCHHGAPNQGHGGWQMINAPEAVWDRILQAMPGEKIPVLWCGRTHPSTEGNKRIVLYIDNANSFPSFGEFRETEVTVDHHLWAFDIAYGISESELAASIGKINSVLRDAELPPILIDVEGRDSYWNLAAPFQNVPQVQPQASP